MNVRQNRRYRDPGAKFMKWKHMSQMSPGDTVKVRIHSEMSNIWCNAIYRGKQFDYYEVYINPGVKHCKAGIHYVSEGDILTVMEFEGTHIGDDVYLGMSKEEFETFMMCC